MTDRQDEFSPEDNERLKRYREWRRTQARRRATRRWRWIRHLSMVVVLGLIVGALVTWLTVLRDPRGRVASEPQGGPSRRRGGAFEAIRWRRGCQAAGDRPRAGSGAPAGGATPGARRCISCTTARDFRQSRVEFRCRGRTAPLALARDVPRPAGSHCPRASHVRGHAGTRGHRVASGGQPVAQRHTGAARDGITPERYHGGRWTSDAPVAPIGADRGVRPHPAHVREHAVSREHRVASGGQPVAQRHTGAARDGIARERYHGGRSTSDAPVAPIGADRGARPHPAHVRGHAVTGEYCAADGRELAAQRDTGAGRDGIAPERYDGGRWSSDAPVGGGYGAPPVEPSRAGTESGMRESARVRQGMVQGRGPGVPRWREARSRRVPRWVRQGAPGAAAAWLEAPRRGIVAPHAARFASAT